MYIVASFFFSSRRRHTRFDCDWSSDVCSSDLVAGERVVALKMDQRSRALTERHDALARDRQHVSESPEPARRRRDLLGAEAIEGGEIERDCEVDRHPLLRASGAAAEQALFPVHRVTAKTLEP